MKTMRDYLDELARLAEDKEPKDGKEPGDEKAPEDEEDEQEQVDEGSYGGDKAGPKVVPALKPAAIKQVERLERQ